MSDFASNSRRMQAPFTTLGILGLFGAGAAAAAESDGQLQEIVVSAQKRLESQQTVPIAVSAFSGETLRTLNVNSTLDLERITPNLTVGQSTGEGGIPVIAIRGVALQDFSDINESPSAVYLDEFYKAALFGLDTQLFDVERAEVLRGPQGTVFGRNATGGLIQFVTRKPTQEFDAYVAATAGDFNQRKIEAAVGGPLSDTLSGRVSALYNHFDGYQENLFQGNSDGNGLGVSAGRVQLLYQPTANLDLSLFYQYSRNSNGGGNTFTNSPVTIDPATGLAVPNPGGTDSTGYRDPTPGDARDVNVDRDGFLKTKQNTAIGRLAWRFAENLELVSVTGYEDSTKHLSLDTDASPAFVRHTDFMPDAREVSEELRLSGTNGSFRWLTGLYYFDYDVDGHQSVIAPTGVSSNYVPMSYSLNTESWAAFASGTYDFTPEWSFTAGARYTNEKKDIAIDIPYSFLYDSNGVFTGFGRFTFDEATVGGLAKQDDDNVSFDTRLSWKPSRDVMAYAGVSRAYKGGTFNMGLFQIPLITHYPVKPEELTSYEVGVKSTLMNGTLRANASVFYYDYKDYQAYSYDSSSQSSEIFNADATVKGVELELVTNPFTGFEASVTASYLDAVAESVADRAGNRADRRMPLAPKWNLTGSLRYSWPAPGTGRLAVQTDAVYKTEQYFDALNSPALYEPSYVVANLRASWTSDSGQWQWGAFVDNVTDRVYRNSAFDFSSFGYVQGMMAKPRWAGVFGSYSWR